MNFEVPPPAENSPEDLNPSPEAPATGNPGDVPLHQLPGMETDDNELSPDMTAPEDYGREDSPQSSSISTGTDENSMRPIGPVASPLSLDGVKDAIDKAISRSSFEADTKKDLANFIAEDINDIEQLPVREVAEHPSATEDGAEVKAFLDSVEPWDGRQPEISFAEQKAAGALVAEAAAEHLSAGRSDEGSLGECRIDQRVDAETGELFHVTTIKFAEAFVKATNPVSYVGVREIRSDETVGQGAVYEIEVGSDGVARRSSAAAQTETEREASRAALQELRLSTDEGFISVPREAVKNTLANAELEEAFGLRRQPIGIDEARRLARMMLRGATESET